MAKKSVLIGVCLTRKDRRFLESFRKFSDALTQDYCVATVKVRDKFLPDAQNEIVENFLHWNYDYLLLLDDDHWGHTKEMFDCLVNANALMATVKTYSRHYPYSCALMKDVNGSYCGIENGEGYQNCDLTGFPMTLLRKEIFTKLSKPYFIGRIDGLRAWATDENFCQRLAKEGIKPVGCFQYCLPHDSITAENVNQRRYKERLENNNIAMYHLFNKRNKENLCMAHQ